MKTLKPAMAALACAALSLGGGAKADDILAREAALVPLPVSIAKPASGPAEPTPLPPALRFAPIDLSRPARVLDAARSPAPLLRPPGLPKLAALGPEPVAATLPPLPVLLVAARVRVRVAEAVEVTLADRARYAAADRQDSWPDQGAMVPAARSTRLPARSDLTATGVRSPLPPVDWAARRLPLGDRLGPAIQRPETTLGPLPLEIGPLPKARLAVAPPLCSVRPEPADLASPARPARHDTGRATITTDPTVAPSRQAVATPRPVLRSSPAPFLRLSIPEPFEVIEAIGIRPDLPDKDPPAYVADPPLPALPVEAEAKK